MTRDKTSHGKLKRIPAFAGRLKLTGAQDSSPEERTSSAHLTQWWYMAKPLPHTGMVPGLSLYICTGAREVASPRDSRQGFDSQDETLEDCQSWPG